MPEFSTTVISLFHSKRQAADQGGLLSGKNPAAYNPADPLRLWIIQVGIIILTTQVLSVGLRRIRQPKVIAEVIGGIILGPTAFGRIPNFTGTIFPAESRPYLSLVANIGLCLFLFLVGLEIEGSIIKRNAKLSVTVALAGMILPFGLGAALAVPVYHHFIDPSVAFTHFMLFTGVAFSITAFPVLCRILTELKLLDTTVGIVVLSAGVGNDVVGWTLLALSVALVNAGSGLTALWILLVCLGWTLFLLFPVRYAFRWLARRTGSTHNGPTMLFMTATMVLVFGSAFFTDIIGVHAIFGAFLAGIIVPREGGLAIALTEKLEDMVSVIFLPLYFTLSGLSTNLGLLNNGIIWAYTIAICAVAFIGKFGGCTMAARLSGFNWREASTIGTLMSCKGLVELIVLNVGLSAGILSQRVFSMFVLEALLLTFMTTPIVSSLYPSEYRVRASGTGANFKNVADHDRGAREKASFPRSRGSSEGDEDRWKTRFTIVLDKIEYVPGMMAFAQLIIPHAQQSLPKGNSDTPSASAIKSGLHRCHIDTFRLIELTDNFSAVMKSSAGDIVLQSDPILGIFRTFSELNDVPISTSLAMVPYHDFASSIIGHAKDNLAQLILLSWLPPSLSPTNVDEHDAISTTPKATQRSNNPFDALFRSTLQVDKSIQAGHSHFIRDVFSQTTTDVALFIDRDHAAPAWGTTQHVYLPFFGGPDDRLALDFVVQLCRNPKLTATVVRMTRNQPDEVTEPETAHLDVDASIGIQDTLRGNATTHTRLQSQVADDVLWERYASHPSGDDALTCALARIEFTHLVSPIPLHAIMQAISSTTAALATQKRGLLVAAGRSRKFSVEDHQPEFRRLIEEHGSAGAEIKKVVGDVATALIAWGCKTRIIVFQAANTPSD